ELPVETFLPVAFFVGPGLVLTLLVRSSAALRARSLATALVVFLVVFFAAISSWQFTCFSVGRNARGGGAMTIAPPPLAHRFKTAAPLIADFDELPIHHGCTCA